MRHHYPNDWVVEFDIKVAFDHIDHGLLMKALRTHIKEDRILLYIERWRSPGSPFEMADGALNPEMHIRTLRIASRHIPEAGAVCGSSARTDLCGGRR